MVTKAEMQALATGASQAPDQPNISLMGGKCNTAALNEAIRIYGIDKGTTLFNLIPQTIDLNGKIRLALDIDKKECDNDNKPIVGVSVHEEIAALISASHYAVSHKMAIKDVPVEEIVKGMETPLKMLNAKTKITSCGV